MKFVEFCDVDGYRTHLINVHHIIRLTKIEANPSYCHLFLDNDKELMILSSYEDAVNLLKG